MPDKALSSFKQAAEKSSFRDEAWAWKASQQLSDFDHGSAFAAAGVIHIRWANSAPRLDTNPMSSFWRGSEPIYMESDALGKTEPKYRTEIRARWTKQNLYFLFVCPYEELVK